MKSSDLNSFFNGTTSIAILRGILKTDVENYANSLKKSGASIHLNLTENEAIFITDTRLKFLLLNVLNNELTSIHLAYICDCLTLCENIAFESEISKELISNIADPEINGGFKSKPELENLIVSL